MLLELEDAKLLAQLAERRTGIIEFHCECLGMFEGVVENLDGPLKGQFLERARQEQSQNPSVMMKVIGAFGSTTAGKATSAAHSAAEANQYWETVQVLCGNGKFVRALADFNDREIAVLKATCAHILALSDRPETADELKRFLFQLNAKLTWAGGRAQYVAGAHQPGFAAESIAAQDLAKSLMRLHVNSDTHEYEQELGNILGQFVNVSENPRAHQQIPASAQAVAGALNVSSGTWLNTSHINASPFKVFESGYDLLLGELEDGNAVVPIGFNGNESLVTVAQPGAGKTQCHVLPNLLTYEGSIVALDPKLELMELTAGRRQTMGHRIFVLNLADDDQPTHRFNVLEFVDRRPEFLWNGVIELAEFLLPESSGDNNPIFRNKAAEMFAVCLGGCILAERDTGETATLSAAIKHIFKSPESLKLFCYDTEQRAAEVGCEALEQSAVALAALAQNENTLEDFQRYQSNATSVLMKYRGGVIDRVAGGKGHWCPEDLRQPGTTLYIRIPYEEMAVYGGFVRMVLYTLIKRLRKGGTEQSNLPITFLLDEVAQLGNLDQIANVIETGRGYGLRAWLIFQDYDQARAASSKPNLLLKTPKVRLFMNPSLETAQDISAELGKLNQVITGKEKPLAEPAELLGPAFADDVVVLSSGARPLRLTKWFAWQDKRYETYTAETYTFKHDGRQPEP